MKEYFIEKFDDRQKYLDFLEYVIDRSDAFSFVYFIYRETDKVKKSTREISDLLRPYKIYSKTSHEWASMITRDYDHIYKLVMYRAVPEVIKALSKVDDIYEWDYPKYPMDLCFFKDGYAWITTCSHEYHCWLYSDDKDVFSDLIGLGTNISHSGQVDESTLFYDEKSKWKKTGDGSLPCS